jgi:hypothetical protein
MFYVTWTEAPDRHWHATASGVSQEELLGLLDDLDITGRAVAPGDLAGFTVEPLALPSDDPAKQVEWFVAYGAGPNDYLMLRAVRRGGSVADGVSHGAPNAWRLTTVRGHRAIALEKDGNIVALSWEELPGWFVSLSANEAAATPDELRTFAESLDSVKPDDPRIKAKLRSAWGDESEPPTAKPADASPTTAP